jgi:hypothetical protein
MKAASPASKGEKMSGSVGLAAVGSATFTGLNGSGSISLPGLKVGDRVSIDIQPGGFESVVSVDDELQQTASSDFSTTTFRMFFFRAC